MAKKITFYANFCNFNSFSKLMGINYRKCGYYIVHDRDASNEGITEGINTANTSKE